MLVDHRNHFAADDRQAAVPVFFIAPESLRQGVKHGNLHHAIGAIHLDGRGYRPKDQHPRGMRGRQTKVPGSIHDKINCAVAFHGKLHLG